jgi:hypothetical protein
MKNRKWATTEEENGWLVRDEKGRPRQFIGSIKGRYGIWMREYRTRIPVKVYEEITTDYAIHAEVCAWCENTDIEWVDNNGNNTPYLISSVNNGK